MSEELGIKNKKEKDFSKWYSEVVQKAEIVDNRFPLQGFLTWYPYGYKSLKTMLRVIEELLEKYGHQEAYFPTLIPKKLFVKEADFLEGFGGESFKITKAGKSDLDEELILRPTSETAMYEIFKLWIRSWRDLPLKIYQTVNVFRYETKMTKPLLRVRELVKFKEAHTVHATAKEAEEQIEEGIEIYKKFFDKLLLPYFILQTPEWDTFPGAIRNNDFFTIMPDKNVIELGSVINLGQKFSKVFDIKYLDKDGKKKYTHQTCYGISERALGVVISLYGDNKGIIFPPNLAPIQVVIVPIFKGKQKIKVLERGGEILGELESEFRVFLDDRDQYTPGFKFNEWELKGVPLRIEIGMKEVKGKNIILVRRDTGTKEEIDASELKEKVYSIFNDMEEVMIKRTKEEMLKYIREVKNLREAKRYLKKGGVVKLKWCGNTECGKKLEEELEVDGLGFDPQEKVKGTCTECKKKARHYLYLGKVPY